MERAGAKKEEDYLLFNKLGFSFMWDSLNRKAKRDILNKIKRVKPSILDNDLRLGTVFSLYTTVMEVKRVYKGEIIGYGTLNRVHNDMVVAILPIGYVDFSLPFVKYVSIIKDTQ